MPSQSDAKKRAFDSLLKKLARKYNVQVEVVRESTDGQVGAAFRKVLRWAHPDKGGSEEDTKALNKAREDWEAAKQARQRQGRPAPEPTAHTESDTAAPVARNDRGKRIQAKAAMLTYQGISGLEQWKRFLVFWKDNLRTWSVKYWRATLESNQGEGCHIHVMVQFTSEKDRWSKDFVFEQIAPRADIHDLLGEGWAASNQRGVTKISRVMTTTTLRLRWSELSHSGAVFLQEVLGWLLFTKNERWMTKSGRGYVRAGKLRKGIQKIKPVKRNGPWTVLCDGEGFMKGALSKEAHKKAKVTLWRVPPRSPDLNPVEKYWPWLKKKLRKMDLEDCVKGKPVLTKRAYIARVRRVVESKQSHKVARNYALGLRNVCKQVLSKDVNGGATRG